MLYAALTYGGSPSGLGALQAQITYGKFIQRTRFMSLVLAQKNIAAFGAFVDIGTTTDGLVHVSQLSDGYVQSVDEVVSKGQKVEVTVLEKENGKLSLSMKTGEKSADQSGMASLHRVTAS